RCAVIHPHDVAVKRLMRVAAGIESQIVGETEILGQIRGAMELSEEAGVSGKVILRLWEKALRCGKRVRTETRLGDGAISVAYGALHIAKKIHGSLDGLSFLIIGAGEISTLVLKNLAGVRGKKITIVNRSPERAELLANRFGGISLPFEDLSTVMQNSDVVISSTSSQNTIISKAAVAEVVKNRRKSLLLVDMGLPRDIDYGCKDLTQVFLYNLDDLARLIQENLDDRRSAMPEAFEILNHEAHRFDLWLKGLQTEPVLRALRTAMEESCQFELELLKDEVDAETHKRLQVLLRRLVKRVLHKPTKDLKSHGEDLEPRFLESLESLFHLDSDSEGAE
ncbi:MAG: glutamyl-tRNA reductase, partial [Planctomycetota bacterium]